MSRLLYNKAIIEKIQDIADKNPDLRFGQILIISDALDWDRETNQVRDPFYEEPQITWERMSNNKICFPNETN